MKTTKRSKMLLSSIAMLLVALVALGSATFAWYSIQRTVTASSLTVQASTPGGLEIREGTSGTWGNSVTWTDSETLQPSRLTYQAGSPGYSAIKVSDSTDSSSALAGASEVTAPLADGNYVIAKTIQLRNTNSVDGEITCTITPTGTTAGTYTALALVDASTGKYAQVESDGTSADALAPTTFKLAKNATDAQKTFYVLAFVDGVNSNCTTANAPKTAISFGIEFTMADTTI